MGSRGVYIRNQPVEDRFWSKVDRSGGPETCWLWTEGLKNGYGQFNLRGGATRSSYAHRLAWTLTNGPIPDGLFLCHKCDVKACCNPAHLFLGTPLDNVRDATAKGRAGHLRFASRTHCPRGHAFPVEQTDRRCGVCATARRDALNDQTNARRRELYAARRRAA